jgi:hypothetical protein
LPEPVADTQQPEPIEKTESAADAAAKSALRQRLAEMERAEQFTRQSPQQAQQPLANEPPQQQPQSIPPNVQEWVNAHPDYFKDPVKAAELQLAAAKCARAGLNWDHADFVPTVERYLGLASAGNGHAQERPAEIERPPAAPVQRPAPVQRRQQYSGPPVSAPPTREAPSMATGRPVSARRPLTPEQREAARFSGVSEQKYQEQLEQMERLKAAGVLQDGR